MDDLGMAYLAGFFIFAMLFWLLVAVGAYIYTSIAYKRIAEKAKYPNPNYAWIPVIGPALISANLAKMPSWPIYLLLGLLVSWIPFLGLIGMLTYLAFAVFFIIWTWKLFEGFGYPGALALLWLVPLAGFVIIGILAWGNAKYDPKRVS